MKPDNYMPTGAVVQKSATSAVVPQACDSVPSQMADIGSMLIKITACWRDDEFGDSLAEAIRSTRATGVPLNYNSGVSEIIHSSEV